MERGLRRESLSSQQFCDPGQTGLECQSNILRADCIDEEFQRTSLDDGRLREPVVKRS
jgi:hypothetical protein